MTGADGSSRGYIAASSVSMAVTGLERGSPIQIDASQMVSTCRKVYDGTGEDSLESQLGISKPDDERGAYAYDESVGNLTDKNHRRKIWSADVQDWVDDPVDPGFETDDHAYGSYSERYISSANQPSDGSSFTTNNSGLAIAKVRGDIIGTQYNDIIMTMGVNELSDYAKEHTPDDQKGIAKDDAFYSNFVSGGNGNDVVIAGRGDNYIRDAAFVWINDCGAQDENFIALPDMPISGVGTTNQKVAPNQKNFVHVNGGKSKIYNPIEFDVKNHTGETPTEAQENDGSYHDDYYEIISGSAEYANPDDEGVVDNPSHSTGTTTFDRSFIETAMGDPYDSWYDQLIKLRDIPEDWQTMDFSDVLGAESELADEMNSFFDAWFGEAAQFAGEVAAGSTESISATPSI